MVTYARDLSNVIYDYLSIIPITNETANYRKELLDLLNVIENKMAYAAPEQFGLYWNYSNNILAKYNDTFSEDKWANAIKNICRYEYDNPDVLLYEHLITHIHD